MCGVQWHSWYSIRLGVKELLVLDSLQEESLCCVLEQDTLSALSTGSTQEDRTKTLLAGM